MGLNSHWTVFRPEFTNGGIDALTRGTIARLFDDFESYADSAALQAAWTETGGAGNPTLATGANLVHGNQSMQVAVAGATGTIYRAINNNFFHYPFPGRIRYISFKGIVTSGTSAIRVRLSDASDATLYREWAFTLGTDRTRDHTIDLNPQNTESNPAAADEGVTTWDETLIDRIEFRNLADGSTYRFDDIRFYYEYSLLDALGLGTEAATDDGADGSVHSKLRYLNNLVLQKIGETQQYSKHGHGYLLLNNAYTFGLELKSSLLVPSTTEINPGNYTINRVRNGTTTEIVASVAADESAGFISASYTPLEDSWQPGDQLLVTFSGGYVDKDTDTAVALAANANATTTTITVANAALFQAGQRVRIYDDTPDSEIQTIVSIDSPTTFTVGALANSYTTAANAMVVLVERTTLETARLASNISKELVISEEVEKWTLSDYDDFDSADADGNTERWDVGYVANSDGSAAGAEGGSADINTTTAGQARVQVDPDGTPTQAAYAIKRDEPSYSRYFSTMVDADVALNGDQATSAFAGLRISAGDVDDASNYILVARERSNAVNRITARAEFMGAAQGTVNFNTSDNAVAFKIERFGNVWNIFYSLTQYPNWQWVKLTQYEDANGDMTTTTSIYLYAESAGTADAQTAVVDFDNFKYFIGSGAIDQLLATSVLASGTFTTSSTTIPADTGRTEGNDYWNATLLMPVTGVAAFQPRTIVDFANAGGVFTMDAQNPFTIAPAVGDEYVILAFQYPLVPAADAASNQTSAHVAGNKSDVASVTAGSASVIARLRAIEAALSVNAAGGGEFELDGVPDLWDALVADSSADASITTLTGNRDAAAIQRLAAIINAQGITDAGTATGFEEDGTGGTLWESLVAVKGTFTTSSATVPADTGRTEANDYFNGDIIVPLSGGIVRQARLIVDFANAGGVITLDPELPFTAVPGLVDYIILHFKQPLVPAADSTNNNTSAHVVGNKADVASLTAGQASIIALLRSLISALSVEAAGAGGGFEIDGSPDLKDALGTTGAVVTDSATSILGAVGADNNNNAFASTNVAANSDGSVLERLEHILVALGGTTGVTSALGTTATAIDTVARLEANDYWNGGVFICVDGANKGLARPIYDFINATGTLYFEPAFPNAVAASVNYLILTRFDVARIVGDNSADNTFDSSAVVANENGSVLERIEDIVRKLDVPAQDAATNTVERDVVGNKTDNIPAMSAAPGNDSIVAHAKAILERIGATPGDPDDSVLTNLGQRDDTATADTLADITTTSIQAKLRRILLRFSSDAFSATIQGGARTDVENMLGQIATYFSNAGAAWSVQVNNNAARDNLEQVLEDLSAVLGCDGANIFNPSIGGAARTDLDSALAAVGTALGVEYDGTPDIYDTIVTGHDSSAILANEDGSVDERLEAIKLDLERAEYQLADYDDFDVADADANTERWDIGYVSGTEGGAADINTTTAGKLYVKVDPDVTPTAAGYGVHLVQPIVSKYFAAIVDVNTTFGTPSGSWATAGMRVSPVAYDVNNVVYLQRQNSSGGVLNRLAAGAIFGGANQGEVYFTTSDTAVAFKIERLDNVWRLYYGLAQYPDYAWVLLTQYEDASENMDSQQSVYLDAYSPGSADAETAQGDFDNFKLYLNLDGISQEIAGDYDSSAVAADRDGSVIERQEFIHTQLGSEYDGSPDVYDTVVTGYDSTGITENGDGSVLERLEELRGTTSTGTFTLTNAMGTAEQTITNYTPIRPGRIAVLLDLNTLVAAGEGGTVVSRLKFMIDGATLRTIDRHTFTVGADEVHPTVSGFVVEGASFVRVTVQANVAVTVNRDIPWRVVEAS